MIDGDTIAKRDGLTGVRAWFLRMAQRRGLPARNHTAGQPVDAMIDNGRLIALCQDCGGAEYVAASDPVFYCLSCGNRTTNGALRPVRFDGVSDG